MKKTVLLFLLSFIYLNASAQLQRQILGQELGKTTKSEALSSLESKGAYLYTYKGEESLYLDNIRFGGVYWKMVMMTFSNGILSSVMFADSPDSYYNDEERDNKWQKISTRFTEKYSNFFKEEKLDEIRFEDGKTFVSVSNQKGVVCIMYFDAKLLLEEKRKEDEEL